MIIKCPECGHQVSDKAPVCPSCGVEIAGKIIRCPHCGEIHFISDGICPNCHYSLTQKPDNNNTESKDDSADTVKNTDTVTPEEPKADEATAADEDILDAEEDVYKEEEQAEQAVQAIPITTVPKRNKEPEVQKGTTEGGEGKKPEKKSHWPLIVSMIIAAVICLVLLFAYNSANQNNEAREYRTAIESRDPSILQSYLDTYKNAPQAHRDSVQALLNAIRASDPQWDKVKSSNDVNALKAYLQQNPNSPHKQEVMNMIDELDWKTALQTHDFANYLSLHQNGRHAAEAVDSVKVTMDMPASGADKDKAVKAVRSFLVAINSHNDDKVRSTVADHLDYFNEKSSVDGGEALNYMAIIYKNAERLNWHVDDAGAAKVSKAGNGSSTVYSITMPARLSVNYTSGSNVQSRYNIQAKVNSSGLITAIKLIRLAEEAPKATEKKAEKKSDDSESKEKKSSEKKSSEKKSSEKKSSSKK